MHFRRDSRSSRLILPALVLLLTSVRTEAQLPVLLPTPTPAPAPETPGDPYQRETPYHAFFRFAAAAQRGDVEAAGEYLEWPAKGGKPPREELVRQLRILLDQAFSGEIERLSRSPLGSRSADLPPDFDRAGQISVGEESVDVLLVRKTTEKYGPIWLFSSQTLRAVPRLYGEMETPGIEKSLPSFLKKSIGALHVWQAGGMLLLLPVLFGVCWFLAQGVLVPLRRLVKRRGWREDIRAALGAARTPLAILLALLLHRLASGLFHLPLLVRFRYERLLDVGFVLVLAWLAIRLVNAFSGVALERVEAVGGTPFPTLTLASRLLKAFVLLLAVLTILQLYGVNLTATLAGLGIGGLAFAFAAKTSIENLFGGFTILGDKILRVGDSCRIGSFVGTVEDVTLFATRLRTVERTVVSIPNGTLLTKEIENLSRRDRFFFQHTIGLRQETTPAQLTAVLGKLRVLLADHQRVAPESARVRFVRFGVSSLDVELNAYVLAADYATFLGIQEELLLAVLVIVAACGTSMAFPPQTFYFGTNGPPVPSAPA
ncbi:MAG: mechanosensitive ion channel family protein [Thermoanaerobaculia bacterium]